MSIPNVNWRWKYPYECLLVLNLVPGSGGLPKRHTFWAFCLPFDHDIIPHQHGRWGLTECWFFCLNLTLIAAPSPTTPSLSSSDLLQAPQEESHHTATVLFDFTPSSEFELGVRGKSVLLTLLIISSWLAEGMTVQILEPDDGSGWVKVKDPSEKNGLVPASYIGTGDKSLEGRSTIQGSSRRGQWP